MEEIIKRAKNALPLHCRRRPWEHINHGVGLLSSRDELNAYIAAYGEMHMQKCRAAYQNFPYEQLINRNFEIVDWGCGQGIATVVFANALKDHELDHLVRKVTLLEPSLPALQVAEMNCRSKLPNTQIETVNKFIPGMSSDDTIDMEFEYNIVIHLFSNILDVPSVDVAKLASAVGVAGHKHYIMCMGCLNDYCYKVDQFCSVFNVDQYFSKIDSRDFATTSDSHYRYTCQTRCFVYDNGYLNLDNVNRYPTPVINGEPIVDDYDLRLSVKNGILTDKERSLYLKLQDISNDNDIILIHPDVCGDRPNFVVIRPGIGVLLINMSDLDLSEWEYGKNEDPASHEEKEDATTLVNCLTEEMVANPITIVNKYRDNLISLHIEGLLGKATFERRYWNIARTAVFFSNSSADSLKKFHSDYTHIFCSENLDQSFTNEFYKKCRLSEMNNMFDSILCNSLLKLLSPEWHSVRQGSLLKLNKEQQELSRSIAGKQQKISGVAGSGKTQVLVERAVKCQARTGKRVLILSFNLTLVNYIKYRLSQVRADFFWKDFYVTNYHQFFKAEATNCNLRETFGCFNNINFFADRKCRKYAAILIDEAQDYQYEWFVILKRYFLEPGGELVIFGDAKQNIFKNELDENRNIRTPIEGPWIKRLNKGYRFGNLHISGLAKLFQDRFFGADADNPDARDLSIQLSAGYHFMELGITKDKDKLAEVVMSTIRHFNLDEKDTVVMSQTCEILRDTELSLRKFGVAICKTTFESYELYNEVIKQPGCSYNRRPTRQFFERIKLHRRNKKLHFTMDSRMLKLSTIHSFKGWESKNVILLVEPEGSTNDLYTAPQNDDTPELIYTAITRAKEQLFVVNLGNRRYSEFFNKAVKSL